MKKYLLIILMFLSCAAQSQTVRVLVGLDANNRPGFLYRDTVYSLSNTPNQYFTGFGTWGNFLDTARSAISYTGENYLSYNNSTGVLTGSAVNLSNTNVTGNLGVSHLNSGTDADASHYWRGDGTWATIAAGGGGAADSSLFWSLDGNVPSATNYMGSKTNTSVRFRTNFIERMVLDSNGRFGLGIGLPLAKFHILQNAIGITQNDANSVLFENQTAATSGNPQYSPGLILGGNFWNTVGSASQISRYRLSTQTTSGANLGGNFMVQESFNGGAYVEAFKWIRSGILSVNGEYVQQLQGGGNGWNKFLSPVDMHGSTTNRYIQFAGTSIVAIGQNNTSQNFTIRVPGVSSATPATTGNQALDVNYLTGSVLLGTETTNTDAILNVSRTDRGVLIPRVTTTQRDSINMTVSSVTVTNGGTGYTSTPTITFTTPTYPGVIPSISGVTRVGNVITVVTVGNVGSYNTANVYITVTGGGGSGAVLTPVMTQVLTEGLMIYNLTVHKLQVWDGTVWNDVW